MTHLITMHLFLKSRYDLHRTCYDSVSFNKCTYLCNPHSYQDIECFHHPRKFPVPVSPQPVTQPEATILPLSVTIDQFYVLRNLIYIALLHLTFSLNILVMFPSLLLHMSAVHSLLLRNSILLNDYDTICFIILHINGHLGSFLFEAIIHEIAVDIFVSVDICFPFS